jgi:hypothetical protein
MPKGNQLGCTANYDLDFQGDNGLTSGNRGTEQTDCNFYPNEQE